VIGRRGEEVELPSAILGALAAVVESLSRGAPL